MPNPISRSEAQFRLRNISAKIAIAQSAAKEGDWRIAFDNAYEAQDLLNILVPFLEEAVDELAERRDKMPEPPGSLKYGTPPPVNSGGGSMGYRGSSYSRPPEPIVVDVTPTPVRKDKVPSPSPRDLRPPKPIIITPPPQPVAKPIITPPPPIPVPPRPAPAPKPAAPTVVIPAGAEVVTLDIDRLMNGVGNDNDRAQMTLLDALPAAFRKSVLFTNAKSRKPVTIFRVGDGAWSIYQ